MHPKAKDGGWHSENRLLQLSRHSQIFSVFLFFINLCVSYFIDWSEMNISWCTVCRQHSYFHNKHLIFGEAKCTRSLGFAFETVFTSFFLVIYMFHTIIIIIFIIFIIIIIIFIIFIIIFIIIILFIIIIIIILPVSYLLPLENLHHVFSFKIQLVKL